MNYLHNMITDGLAFGIPLFIMAVGAIYSEKSGVTNLAVEGFQDFGAFCNAVLATILALYAGLSTQTILYIALAMALVGGGFLRGPAISRRISLVGGALGVMMGEESTRA